MGHCAARCPRHPQREERPARRSANASINNIVYESRWRAAGEVGAGPAPGLPAAQRWGGSQPARPAAARAPRRAAHGHGTSARDRGLPRRSLPAGPLGGAGRAPTLALPDEREDGRFPPARVGGCGVTASVTGATTAVDAPRSASMPAAAGARRCVGCARALGAPWAPPREVRGWPPPGKRVNRAVRRDPGRAARMAPPGAPRRANNRPLVAAVGARHFRGRRGAHGAATPSESDPQQDLDPRASGAGGAATLHPWKARRRAPKPGGPIERGGPEKGAERCRGVVGAGAGVQIG